MKNSLAVIFYVLLTCKVLLFDLDGVLVDSTPAVARVWGQWALEHHLDPARVVSTAHGRRSIETIRLMAPQLNPELENVNVERMEIAAREGVTALPGAADLLRSLPPGRFAIVTSATRALARARLQYAGLPESDSMISADDVSNGKPSPDPYLKGAKLLGALPADCLVFEDTPNGIMAAQAAGMQVIALRSTYPADDLKAATAVIGSLEEVRVELSGLWLSIRLSDTCHPE